MSIVGDHIFVSVTARYIGQVVKRGPVIRVGFHGVNFAISSGGLIGAYISGRALTRYAQEYVLGVLTI